MKPLMLPLGNDHILPAGDRLERGSLRETVLLILVDMVMLEAAFLTTYWFRFHSGIWLVPLGIPPLSAYLVASLVVLLVFFGIFYFSAMYTQRGVRSFEDDLVGLFKGVVLASLLVLASTFFLRTLTFSRSFFGLFFLSTFFFLTLGRVGVRQLTKRWNRGGEDRIRTLLVGVSPMRERLLRLTRELPGLEFEPVGWLRVGGQDEPDDAAPESGGSPLDARGPRRSSSAVPALPCLGGVEDVRSLVLEHRVDLVLLTVPFDRLPLISQVAGELANLKVDLQFIPDLLALHTSKMRLQEIGGIPFISIREGALSAVDRIVKRTFDLLASGLGLLFLAPALAVIALLVKLSSPGPIFFRQERLGQDGRRFAMVKFRSMRTDAEQDSGPVWTTEDDPRVTGVGRSLRRFSLDELPQLWNVLRGEMSLVGPRPERRVFVEKFTREMPRYFERHRVKAGLTGWAQVNGLRGNTSIEERTYYDLYYLENWSLGLDVKILLMTLHHVLRGENAY